MRHRLVPVLDLQSEELICQMGCSYRRIFLLVMVVVGGLEEACLRLVSVLSLEACVQAVHLDFAQEHANSYNELVEVIERNLLLADWFDVDHKVHPYLHVYLLAFRF